MTSAMGWLPSGSYTFVSKALGVVMIVAGSLKAQQWVLSSIKTNAHVDLLTPAIIAFELLLGSSLFLGIRQRLTRYIAAGCFCVFLNVALFKVLDGASSCGCFGKFALTPWIAFAFDTLALLLLLVCKPVPVPMISEEKNRLWVFASLCVVVSALLLTSVVFRARP